jgi:hypothetical protein
MIHIGNLSQVDGFQHFGFNFFEIKNKNKNHFNILKDYLMTKLTLG